MPVTTMQLDIAERSAAWQLLAGRVGLLRMRCALRRSTSPLTSSLTSSPSDSDDVRLSRIWKRVSMIGFRDHVRDLTFVTLGGRGVGLLRFRL